MNIEKFDEDLDFVLGKLCTGEPETILGKMQILRDSLLSLHHKNMVKINHSVMELVCAKYLILNGYDVDLERPLDGISCDIYASKGLGVLIVEIETGFVPPEHALDPSTYCRARIASKITRYSSYAEKFILASPPYYVMQIHPALIRPPRDRHSEEISEIKSLCDLHYSNPQVTLEEVRNARLHSIYTLDVDRGEIREDDPSTYFEKTQCII